MKICDCILVLGLAVGLAGCGLPPHKGGKATTSQSAGHIIQSVAQGDNSAQPTRQGQETERTKAYTLPAGSRLIETSVSSAGGKDVVTNQLATVLSEAMPVVERETTKATTELGPAQKDTARELLTSH